MLPTTENQKNVTDCDNKVAIHISLLLYKQKTLFQAYHYMSKNADGASPVYCNFWLYLPAEFNPHTQRQSYHLHGSGRASGYGYDKTAAAITDALRQAKIDYKQITSRHNIDSFLTDLATYLKLDPEHVNIFTRSL